MYEKFTVSNRAIMVFIDKDKHPSPGRLVVSRRSPKNNFRCSGQTELSTTSDLLHFCCGRHFLVDIVLISVLITAVKPRLFLATAILSRHRYSLSYHFCLSKVHTSIDSRIITLPGPLCEYSLSAKEVDVSITQIYNS